jgi:hypothetical protein
MRSEDDRPWFGARRFGYGLSPITWEGWASVGVFAIALSAAGRLLGHSMGPGRFQALAAGLTAVLLGLVWLKRDRKQKIRWRWGDD